MANTGARATWMSSSKWNDPWYLGLTVRQRNLFDYLAENGDNTCAGVYQYDPSVAKLKTSPWKKGEYEETCAVAFAGHVAFYPGNWVWVVNYAKHNCQEDNKNAWIGAARVVELAPLNLQANFINRYGDVLAKYDQLLEAPSYPLEAPSGVGEGAVEGLEQSSPPLPSPNRTTGASHHQECVDEFHKGYLSLTKTKPVIDSADTKLLKHRLSEFKGTSDEWRKVLAVIRHAVSGRDEKFAKEPPALRTILSGYHFNRIQGQLSMEASQ